MKIWINRAGQNLGTFTLEEVQRGLDQGQFVPTDLAWQEGMETWKSLSDFPGVTVSSVAPVTPVTPDAPAPQPVQPLAPVSESVEPAWERSQELGWHKAFFVTIRQVLFEPQLCFARMPRTTEFWKPTTFILLMVALQLIVVAALLVPLFSFVLATGQANTSDLEALRQIPVILLPFLALLSFPIAIAANLISAGIYHLILKIFGVGEAGYMTTYRVVSYAQATQVVGLLGLIPCVGILFSLAALAWLLVATIIGLQKAHQCDTWKAALAVAIPIALCFFGVAALYFVALFAGGMNTGFDRS
jgi:hypothetical protein